jgi:opacity protein-like surface antigen
LSVVPAYRRVLIFTAVLLFARSTDARADFLITPFVGSVFGGSTTLLDLDVGAVSSKHWTFGASAAWLSDHVLGVEGDFATAPGFFQNSGGNGLVIGSRVTTLTGNVIAALPLSVTRESLRPYVTGGLGLVRARAEDLVGLQSVDSLGLQLGAGAIGLISQRAGVRFDLRHSRALSRDLTLRGERTSKLSFWRATFGVTLRY